MSASTAFHLLDARIQQFLWDQQWEALRPAQEAAIPIVLGADRDVIVAAATAAGKTEAAFLPALTHLLSNPARTLIVYVSPLKALINDQFGRLDYLCESLDIPVWPWHGDISALVKARFLTKRAGVLLITPEALEATLCNRGTSVKGIFENTAYIVIDELHAFIGSERGKQLQSLLRRIDAEVGRPIVRIGLSATLGDMGLAQEFLRPGAGANVALVAAPDKGSDLKVLVKGFEEPLAPPLPPKQKPPKVPKPEMAEEGAANVEREEGANPEDEEEPEPESVSPGHIAAHLFKVLRGSNNLVFANSRRDVEKYTNLLQQLCAKEQVPNEFWPHHGSLSHEMRAGTEAALKRKDAPATAVCTNTLELGIDIGAVQCVAQVGPPPRVASLRQRLGRSGRRKGESAVLRGYCIESALHGRSTVDDHLRLDTVQLAAMISLLTRGWFEPPRTGGLHFSTLVQQLLAIIGQRGGATVAQLFAVLCGEGAPFDGVSRQEFLELVRHLGQKDILMQESSGALLHGPTGEKMFNHYTFFAAFATQEEYRLVCEGKTLGTLPVSQALTVGQRLLFGGKAWAVVEVAEKQKTVHVARAKGGTPPMFTGGSGDVHTQVRQEMRRLLQSSEELPFLDSTAKRFFQEARDAYAALNLARVAVLPTGSTTLVLTWMGDAGNQALAALLRYHGLQASAAGFCVEVSNDDSAGLQVAAALKAIARAPLPALEGLLAEAKNLECEKWDWCLPESLLRKSYASLHLDLDEAHAWAGAFERTAP